MTVLYLLYFGTAALLWLSIFGYVLVLSLVALSQRQAKRNSSSWSDIAIVIPTLNDEGLIFSKIADLRRTDYPSHKITVIVVDGGSVDRTPELVRQKIAQGEAIELVCLNGTRGRVDQINQALRCLEQDVVVVTNVDAMLDPSCIRELVSMLENDPQTAVVGATVRPAGGLLEERIHWWFLNYLWWLEGEAFSSAGVCGVCYAFKRATVVPLDVDALADDIHVALAASARGFRVRICSAAHATEVRVPQTARELVKFRRRRGVAYLSELRSSSQYSRAPLGWKLVRFLRLWHFLVTPKVGVVLAVLACILLVTPHWPWLLFSLLAFGAPAIAAFSASTTLADGENRWWRLSLYASRLLALTLISMLTLTYDKQV
jgi:cellulose synthase/poly-beta-1,6-N-acetylglucosamine synthase-like glycosyltransferase